MKADSKRLAWLFFEAGMITPETFARATGRDEQDAKGVLDVLKKDVSVKSLRELMTLEVDLTFSTGSPLRVPRKPGESGGIHDALSQPVYITEDELRSMLTAWKPPLDFLVQALAATGAIEENPEDVLEGLGKGATAYNRLIDRGHLDTRSLNRLVKQVDAPIKRRNRLLLALELLEYNDILEAADVKDILENFDNKGPESLPQIDEELLSFIQSGPDVPQLNLLEVEPLESLRKLLPPSFVRQNLFLPHRRQGRRLEVVVADPFYVSLSDTLSFLTGLPVLCYYAPSDPLIQRIQEVYGPAQGESVPTAAVRSPEAVVSGGEAGPATRQMADRGTAVELVSTIIEGGIKHRATDVHLEPETSGEQRVRYRIDGRLRVVTEIPVEQVNSVISRIKVLANMDVTERRRPQDGHFSLTIGEGRFDFRVSTLPTHLGEKTVVRILDASRVLHSLEDLGMDKDQSELLGKWIARPHGLILVTGPTGAGKTSTLYACLNTVNNVEQNIVTIEDPVEYSLKGINQVQVDAHQELGFASGLRTILRQDPDIIMVGEIRDPETATIAMRAALTGHLVFTTLHTNTAAGAIATLGQMGIKPYMTASAVTGTVNQRLLRRLDPDNRERFVPKKALLESLGIETRSRKGMYRPSEEAAQSIGGGYIGRTGVFELMPMSDEMAQAVVDRKSESELVALTRQSGLTSIFDHAIRKLYEGETSPEEVLDNLVSEE